MASLPESHIDLISQPFGCVITTLAPNGLPQSTGMWFLYEEGKVRFSLLEKRKKYRNLRENSACTFFLMSPHNMGETIEVRGNATFETDDEKDFVTRVRKQYGASGPPKEPAEDQRWIITIEPTKINTTGKG